MAEVNLGMNLYDFNKQAMSQEKPLDFIMLNKAFKLIYKTLTDKFYGGVESFNNNRYWMLLCNERHDYTVFRFEVDFDSKKFLKDLQECLLNRGAVLSIELTDEGNFEIWIRDELTNENFVYYFFNYTEAVIEEK